VKRDALVQALRETRELVARSDNDYAWSPWENREAALREMDALIARVLSGAVPDATQLGALFAPTGPLQEVSLSSGWADAFLDLANRIDGAMR
jgi:hypothetical protein